MPESPEHTHIKKLLRQFFSNNYGVAVEEYYSSGFEIDVFSVTLSSVTIMVETIWTITATNFYRDLTIVLSEDAKVKIVIVNPKILENVKLVRYFERIKVSEARKGYSVIGMLGWSFSNEASFLEELKNQIDEILESKRESVEAEIERLKGDVFNKNIPLSATISKCIDLCEKVKLFENREWLRCELYGYYDYLEKGKNMINSVDCLPGKPYYRRLIGKVTFYFGPSNIFEQDFPIIIAQPINEIGSWIRIKPGSDLLIYMPPPSDIVKLFKQYGLSPEQKMPIMVTRLSLEGLIDRLRNELHRSLGEASKHLDKS